MLTGKSTRTRILDAAEQLMRGIGLARATTKEIARAAGCSEAALYKHFSSKEELFVQVLKERLPRLNPLLDELNSAPARRPGECGPGGAEDPEARPVRENLLEVVRQAALFYESSVPIAASLYAEPRLKERHYKAVAEMGAGPETPVRSLADYLRRERGAGRLRPDADPEAAASLLLGACAQRAFVSDFARTTGKEEQGLEEFAVSLVDTVLGGIGG
ncbi:TetR/AcrR family transcriptional regulator [Streptomyces sp. ODS28]|uniref:TetR/AcrR family transcriptional regulator n=1 Tax=Streptomyces sp. ODS28 TaxID=3136688 RepID=UPI0031EE2221